MAAIYRLALVAALLSIAACTVHGDKTPPLTGPSEYALSITVTATPDSIAQDGASQASIVVTARDANGKALPGLSLRLQTEANGISQDYGTLSAGTISTGTDGKATSVYTAPPPPPSGEGSIVTIRVTPTGSNYQTSASQTAAIRLIPPGVVVPPRNAYPTASFIGPPSSIEMGASATFDATLSCATQAPCTDGSGIASYSWDFGDGGSAGGRLTTHSFGSPGTYVVTLRVLNVAKLTGSVSKTVTVTIPKPIALFVISPTDPTPGTEVTFNAGGSTVALGHSLIQFIWDFGQGAGSQLGTSFMKVPYPNLGTYTVVLTVVDDTGQRATTTLPVAVKARTTTAAPK